tara:strand:+ start:91 stop:219 length:129 start_codon:yes stop_codon:yes gene_type:complete
MKRAQNISISERERAAKKKLEKITNIQKYKKYQFKELVVCIY